MREEFTPEQTRKISQAAPEQLYNAILGTLILQTRNEDGAVFMLENLLRSDMPIEEIFAKFADAQSGEAYDRPQDQSLRAAFIRALTWRRQQLRKIWMAANARNN